MSGREMALETANATWAWRRPKGPVLPPMTNRKTLAEMVGELLREAAALVAVFGLLDELVRKELTGGWLVGTIVVAVLFFAVSATMEMRRS